MHMTAVVVELIEGRKVVILNNRKVYVSTDQGRLEPGSITWLRSMAPVGSKVTGCSFYCGSAKETSQLAKDF